MPLFHRSDGTLVRDLPAFRRILPYLMRRRNESAVFIDMRVDVTRTRKWIRACNRASSGEACNLLHLFLYVLSRVVADFPELNRFVSGRRVYQRHTATASLVVRESLTPNSAPYTVKVPAAEPEEALAHYARRLSAILRNAREFQKPTEREIELVMRLPDPLVRLAVWARDKLDEWNLLPGFMIRNDPMYTTIFIAEMKSLAMPGTFHHLYECGTCGLFAVVAAREREPGPGGAGSEGARDIIPIRWTVDERVADGALMAAAMHRVRSWLEDPAQIAGLPEQAGQGDSAAPMPAAPEPACSLS
jgi:hypothetical protein